jgi:hypothetical protein
MNEAEEHLSPCGGGATIWPQTGATSNEVRDSSSDHGAKQENLIKRRISSLCVTVVQVQSVHSLNIAIPVVATLLWFGQVTIFCFNVNT